MGRVTLSRRVVDGLRFAGSLLLTVPAVAQCSPTLQPAMPMAGVDGEVRAFAVWDPDGAGPLQPRTVIGGDFEIAGAERCIDIAQLDPVTASWQPLGDLPSGYGASIEALAVLPNGQLVAGGSNLAPGGGRVVRWNGSTWQPLGATPSGVVRTMALAPNGDLVVGGSFSSIDGVAAGGIARWNGATWSAFAGIPTGQVRALAFTANGDLYAGGSFLPTGAPPYDHVARWDGANWVPLGGGILDGEVYTLLPLSNGRLIVGGSFYSVDGGVIASAHVAQWDGTGWRTMGTGVGNLVSDACELPGGDVVIVGLFLYASGVLANGLARWDGAAWSTPYPLLTQLASPAVQRCAVGANGRLCIAGFLGAGFRGVAEWDGLRWSAPAEGIDGGVSAAVAGPDGDVFLGGGFHALPGLRTDCIARWDGASWHALGAGLQGAVQAIAVTPAGLVYAGGLFESAGAVAAMHVAMWNGSAWQPLGGGITHASYANGGSLVEAMAVLPSGDLVVAGSFDAVDGLAVSGVARWDGVSWHTMGNGLGIGATRALAVRGSAVYAGGTQGVIRWDGTAWSSFGGWINGPVEALAFLPDGQLVAGGSFTSAGGTAAAGVARWNGTLWWPVGTGAPSTDAMTALPDGDLIATGRVVVGTLSIPGIFRWSGGAWTMFGGQLELAGKTLCWSDSGALFCGGGFRELAGAPHPYLAHYATDCAAEVVSHGAGCAGSGGTAHLRATSPAWLGGTYRSEASGLPANGLAVVVRGLQSANLPLAAVLPLASPLCVLSVSPFDLGVAVPVGGAITTALPIPDQPSLIGLVLHEQIVALDLDPLGALVGATSSNRLTMILGDF
ncbi:MAG: hypothetical protein H6835_13550 [Planctomycetes bacterium]|nr:hypothetical protein [Planctomycetota bacterium]